VLPKYYRYKIEITTEHKVTTLNVCESQFWSNTFVKVKKIAAESATTTLGNLSSILSVSKL
jgi:hypothetical protein